MAQKKLGQILIGNRLITPPQLADALSEQKRINIQSKRKFKIGEILLFARFIDVADLQSALLKQKPRADR